MARPSFAGPAALGCIVLGASIIAANMLGWQSDEYYFARQAAANASVTGFFLAEGISLFILLLGFYLAYTYLRSRSSSPSPSLVGILGSAIADQALLRAGLVAASLYGLLYAFSSSVLVYQPGVDFAAAYGATGVASWSTVPCCGSYGTVPEVILYLSPVHLALQLVPLSVLLLFIVPPLVGLNITVALLSVRRTVARATGRWMVACGAAVGLFTACPTCAGFFLAESIGGLGVTTLAVAFAPYQALFIGVSVPLLVGMPFFFAARVRSSLTPRGGPGAGGGQRGWRSETVKSR